MNNSIFNTMVNLCPDVPLIKAVLTGVKVKKVNSHYISEKEIMRGENSDYERKIIVQKYRRKWSSYLKSTEDMADRILTTSERFSNCKDKESIRIDILFCRLAYGFQADEYLCFGLEQQTPEERRKWVSDVDRYVAIYRMNDIKAMQILNNKAKTYKLFGQFYGRNAISVKKNDDFGKFKAFVESHSEFVKKKVDEGMGRSVELIRVEDIDNIKDYFQKLIRNGEHILEEKIVQCSVMANLNPSSVNTVRCITFLSGGGNVQISYCFLKVGRNGSFVDNGGAGGILAGIDVRSGKVNTYGHDEYNKTYETHPDTGVKFDGYQMPDWEKLKAICCKLSGMIPSVKCVGWDMAYTDDGWVVVEGNGMTQFIVPQIVYQKGIKKELLSYMDKLDLLFPLPHQGLLG